MKPLGVFSARDLRNRSGSLLKDAEEGRMSLITKHGRPAALVAPFDAQLLELGAHRHLAVRVYATDSPVNDTFATFSGLTACS